MIARKVRIPAVYREAVLDEATGPRSMSKTIPIAWQR